MLFQGATLAAVTSGALFDAVWRILGTLVASAASAESRIEKCGLPECLAVNFTGI
jgi:hypothetical protein